MRLTIPSPSRVRGRSATAAGFVAVLALALAPAAAADEHGAEEPVVIDEEPAPGDEQDEPDEPDDGDGLQDAQVRTQPVVDPCTDVLLAVSPDRATGNEAAVAITAQAIDRDQDGWINVSWAAAAGTELTAVTLHRVDGTVTLLVDDLATGSAQDVLELTFCGTTTQPAPADPEPEPEPEPAPEPAPEPEPETPVTGDGTSGSSGSGSSTGGSSEPVPDAPASDGGEDAEDPAAAEEERADEAAQEPTVVSDTDGDTDGDAEEADDTEVLGVQLTREDGGGGLDGSVFALILAGIAAAGAGGYLVARRAGLFGLGGVR